MHSPANTRFYRPHIPILPPKAVTVARSCIPYGLARPPSRGEATHDTSMKTIRSSIERLEARIAPANILAVVSGHTLKITGSDAADTFTVQDLSTDGTAFVVFSPSSGTVNGGVSFTTPPGITDIAIDARGGVNQVTVSARIIFDLKGSLTFKGGTGTNEFDLSAVTVEKNLTVTNGAHVSGVDATNITDSNIYGSVKITNGDGDTETVIHRDSVGVSAIRGNLSITNGKGRDTDLITDYDFGGNFTIKNGHADAVGQAGTLDFFHSSNNSDHRSVIRGNVSVSYLDGNSSLNTILDAEIGGNVSFNYGGDGATFFDGLSTGLPDLIHGNLSIVSKGDVSLAIGAYSARSGLELGGNLTVTAGIGIDNMVLNKLHVAGATRIALGTGGSTTQVDDSVFDGAFSLTSGMGKDIVNIETSANTTAPTSFLSAVAIKLGDAPDNDIVTVSGNAAGEEVVIARTFVFHHGTGAGQDLAANGHIIFPFGGYIDFVA